MIEKFLKKHWNSPTSWDLTALLNAADPKASQAERHLWLIHLVEWLTIKKALPSAPPNTQSVSDNSKEETPTDTPWTVRRFRHLINVLQRNPEALSTVSALLLTIEEDLDWTGLWADFAFAPRSAFISELKERIQRILLPSSPDSRNAGILFGMIFHSSKQESLLDEVEPALVANLVQLILSADTQSGETSRQRRWNDRIMDAIDLLAQRINTDAHSNDMRHRLENKPGDLRIFQQLTKASAQLRDALEQDDSNALIQSSIYLRAVLSQLRGIDQRIHDHFNEHGISVEVVFQLTQFHERISRIESLINLLCTQQPAAETWTVWRELAKQQQQRRGIHGLLSAQYSLLARKVAERSAETGAHYITRSREEYFVMLKDALKGGAVLAGTTFAKFGIGALGLVPFWGGVAAGLNYATSFVVIHLMHGTVATKQPAMTAPALAAKLKGIDDDEVEIETFVDEVVHLVRSQFAGIVGNLLAVIPTVLLIQLMAMVVLRHPLINTSTAHYVLTHNSLWGATPLYAAFTGVILFLGSVIAGWAENWFVLHRLDSAIAWNPRIRAWLGTQRASRWAAWWRQNISAIAANVSLGFMLGVVPVVAQFFGLPLDVRHVTLAAGQITAALATEGYQALLLPATWLTIAAVPIIGILNLTVSFGLAFQVALRSRSIRVLDRRRIRNAIVKRFLRAPLSFFTPTQKATEPSAGMDA